MAARARDQRARQPERPGRQVRRHGRPGQRALRRRPARRQPRDPDLRRRGADPRVLRIRRLPHRDRGRGAQPGRSGPRPHRGGAPRAHAARRWARRADHPHLSRVGHRAHRGGADVGRRRCRPRGREGRRPRWRTAAGDPDRRRSRLGGRTARDRGALLPRHRHGRAGRRRPGRLAGHARTWSGGHAPGARRRTPDRRDGVRRRARDRPTGLVGRAGAGPGQAPRPDCGAIVGRSRRPSARRPRRPGRRLRSGGGTVVPDALRPRLAVGRPDDAAARHRAGAGTLRTLARRQGTATDPRTDEEPGKILHEVRRRATPTRRADPQPASVYYGTVDATPLWVTLLHDAWRWGLAADQVAALAAARRAGLAWQAPLGDAAADGLLEYVDSTGSGLANQGWKDSGDSIRWRDGRLAVPPIALVEIQAYASRPPWPAPHLLRERLRPARRGPWEEWAAECAAGSGRLLGLRRGRALPGGRARRGQAPGRLRHLRLRPPARHRAAGPRGERAARRPAGRARPAAASGCARSAGATRASTRSATTSARCGRTTRR